MIYRIDPPNPHEDWIKVSLTLDCSYAAVKDALEETFDHVKDKERYQWELHPSRDRDGRHLFEIRDPTSAVLGLVKVIESKPGAITDVVLDNRDPDSGHGRKALKAVIIIVVRVFSQKVPPKYMTEGERAKLMMDLQPYWPP